MKKFAAFFLFFSTFFLTLHAQVYKSDEPLAHTFSIVARDSVTGKMAVGVQSHWFSVGTVVSWGEAGVGVVATQSLANISFGPRGLKLLKEGKSAEEALQILIASDEGEAFRQVAIVDAKGNVAAHTGSKCIDYACHYTGNGFSVQANMMLTDDVCQAMTKAYESADNQPLAERVVAAMLAAQKAGGDIRGKQSAALLVVKGKASDEPWNDKLIDIQIADHQEPLKELKRLLSIHRAYEHMNKGDLAIEKDDIELAKKEYGAAQQLFPQNLEMQYWTAISLANSGDMKAALPIFKKIFKKDKNWKTLTKRLPKVGLLNVSETDMKKILSL